MVQSHGMCRSGLLTAIIRVASERSSPWSFGGRVKEGLPLGVGSLTRKVVVLDTRFVVAEVAFTGGLGSDLFTRGG